MPIWSIGDTSVLETRRYETQVVPHNDIEYSIPTSSGSYGQSTDITVPVPG